jgi:branched-chain amino acid transport system permease protein
VTAVVAPPRRLADVLTANTERIVVGLLATACLVLPGHGHFRPLPVGIYAQGIVFGAALALQAVGLVLVYRSNRIVNFAQVQLGVVAGSIFLVLVNTKVMLLGLHSVCGCLEVRSFPLTNQSRSYRLPVDTPRWLLDLNLWLALVLALVAALVITYAVHRLIVRPFEDRSPLVLTVVTIALSQAIASSVAQGLSRYGGHRELRDTIRLPLPLHWRIRPATFSASDIVLVVATVGTVVALHLLLRRTSLGVLLRGLADNADRARTLGIDTTRVRSRAWLMAGGLSAIAAVLGVSSFNTQDAGDPRQLVRLLAVFVIARQERLLLAVAAAVTLRVFDQSVLFALRTTAIIDVLLFVLVAGVLLLQRRRDDRVDTETVSATDFGVEVRPVPAELRAVPAVRSARRNIAIAIAGLLLGMPFVLSQAQQRLATSAVISGVLALSLLILTGWAGQISLGQFGFAAVGAYVVAVVHLPFPVPLILGGLAGSAAAVIVGLPALRLRGLTLAITTLAFGQAAATFLLSADQLGRHLPSFVERPFVLGIDLEASKVFYYFCLIVLVATVGAVTGMRRSRTARALIAARDNAALAQAFGISLVRARLSAFALSGFLAAIAGALIAYDFGDIKPATFGVTPSFTIFLAVVVGGLGGISPPLIGAAFYGILAILSGNPLINLLATAYGTLVVLRALPGGIGAGLFRLRDGFLRRVADRNHIEVPSLVANRAAGRSKAPIASTRRGGGRTYLPVRYRLDEQWSTVLRRAGRD